MINVFFFVVGLLTLTFCAICIIGMYEIHMDAKTERKRKKALEEWNRRLP